MLPCALRTGFAHPRCREMQTLRFSHFAYYYSLLGLSKSKNGSRCRREWLYGSREGHRSREGERCFLLPRDEDGVENGSTALEEKTDLEEEKDFFYCREMKMGSRMALYGSRKGDRSRGGEGCFLLPGDEDGVENGSKALEKETDLEEEKDVFYCREMKMGSRMALRL